MIDKISKTLKHFQVSLYSRFNKNAQEAMEMMLMLDFGHIFDIFTPNQMAEILGIDMDCTHKNGHLVKTLLIVVSLAFPQTHQGEYIPMMNANVSHCINL